MKKNVSRAAWALASVTAIAAGALVATACSSSGAAGGGGPTGSGADGGGNPSSSAECTTSTLTVSFAPMYSAYDGTHTFQVPAVVDGIAVGAATWAASDPSMVSLTPDPTTGGVMITTEKAGTVTITARAGTLCGSSTLKITATTPADYDVGNARYNDGVVLRFGRGDGGADGGVDASAAKQAACTNCHGPTATNGAFKDVAHTPEQTGGFSDEELIAIFTTGVVPDGGYFDPAIIPYSAWQRLHNWSMTPEEAQGVVAYLRGITPAPQAGTGNFGGRDGGRPPRDAATD